MKFRSTKVKDGYSTCFRQWRADGTHCKFLHGYGTSVKFTFEGELDERNWVADFGGFKTGRLLKMDGHIVNDIDGKSPDKWLDWLLDHTTIVAEDDPSLEYLKLMNKMGVIQLRIIPDVGAERFAEYIGKKIDEWIRKETSNRVHLVECEFREHEKNSAIYILNDRY